MLMLHEEYLKQNYGAGPPFWVRLALSWLPELFFKTPHTCSLARSFW
jgi:hypothetical protein